MKHSVLGALLGALFLSSGSPAHAADAPPADAKKAEAAQRFDRGLSLFDDGDNSGALAEFKRTYELFPNPVVLYNIGLVYAAMNRPVNAVDALEPALAGGGLSAAQTDRAKKTLDDQKARIGRLTVTTTPEGARVEVDNVEVAKTPLTGPLRVSEGTHIVGAVSEGFAPARKEVVIAGNSDATVALELVPTQGKQLANLTITTPTRAAEVRVDGEVAGKTPLATSITLVAGHHKVELRRAGYVAQTREVDVGAGATGDLAFTLAVDEAALGTEGATLALDPSEPHVDLAVDGTTVGPYGAPVRLPRGIHRIAVNSAGFYPVERDVELVPDQINVIKIDLQPTPEKRAAYMSNASFHRTWGWIGIAAGAVIGGASAAFLVVSSSSTSKDQDAAKAARDVALGKNANNTDECNFMSGLKGQSPEDCQALLDGTQAEVDRLDNKAQQNKIIGFTGIGVGAAVAITGVVILLTGDDPNRYDRPASSRALGKRSDPPRFAFGPGPGQVGAGFSLAF